jgi:hypothetical protein
MLSNRKYYAYIIILFILFTTGISFAQANQYDPYVIRLTKQNTPGYITINNMDGATKITGYNGNDILIYSSLKNKRDFREYISVVSEKTGNGVLVSTNSDDYPINLNIKVPYSFSVTATSSEGRIDIYNMAGELAINNTDGLINIYEFSGYGLVSCVDGKINAFISKSGIKGKLSFNSIDGEIELYLPEQLNVNIYAKSESGDLYSNLNLSFNAKGAEMEKSRKKGLSKISVEEGLYGKINRGGQLIKLNSVDGSIFLKKAK